jgi:hypothetical protein
MARPIAHALWVEAPRMVVEGSLPDTAPVNPRLKLLTFIAAPRKRRDRRFVARDVRSGRSGVTRSIEAA